VNKDALQNAVLEVRFFFLLAFVLQVSLQLFFRPWLALKD